MNTGLATSVYMILLFCFSKHHLRSAFLTSLWLQGCGFSLCSANEIDFHETFENARMTEAYYFSLRSGEQRFAMADMSFCTHTRFYLDSFTSLTNSPGFSQSPYQCSTSIFLTLWTRTVVTSLRTSFSQPLMPSVAFPTFFLNTEFPT